MGTITLQPDAASGNDAYIKSGGAATTNYGASDTLLTGELDDGTSGLHRAFIKFDLSSIPIGPVKIESATLTLTHINDYASNTRTMYVRQVYRNWIESEITWNIYSTGNNWQTAGASGSGDTGNWFGVSVGSISIPHNQGLGSTVSVSISTDITTLKTYYGFVLWMETEENDGHGFASSDHANSSYRPKLVVTYRTLDSVLMVQ